MIDEFVLFFDLSKVQTVALKTLTNLMSQHSTMIACKYTKFYSQCKNMFQTCFCTGSLYYISCCDSPEYLSYFLVIQSAKIILPMNSKMWQQ